MPRNPAGSKRHEEIWLPWRPLMRKVEQHACLYRRSDPSYKVMESRDEAWTKILGELQKLDPAFYASKTVLDLRHQWNSLRDKMRREVIKGKKRVLGRPEPVWRSNWCLFRDSLYLEGQFEPGPVHKFGAREGAVESKDTEDQDSYTDGFASGGEEEEEEEEEEDEEEINEDSKPKNLAEDNPIAGLMRIQSIKHPVIPEAESGVDPGSTSDDSAFDNGGPPLARLRRSCKFDAASTNSLKRGVSAVASPDQSAPSTRPDPETGAGAGPRQTESREYSDTLGRLVAAAHLSYEPDMRMRFARAIYAALADHDELNAAAKRARTARVQLEPLDPLR